MTVRCLEIEKNHQHNLRLCSVFLFLVTPVAIISGSHLVIAMTPEGGPMSSH